MAQAYLDFVEKFKPKKTTDDCYTPANIYEVVAGYVADRYGIQREAMVRPFWPGGDYELFDYPAGCCVVDNPPFSIVKRICRDYQERQIRFFLFCPYLTAAGITKIKGTALIVTPESVIYENGAEVATCFVTNLEPETMIRTDVALLQALAEANAINRSKLKKSVPKYSYPDHVLTVQKVGYFCIHNTDYRLDRKDCCHIDTMDMQRGQGKSVFGSGFLLSDRAAAERAQAERLAIARAEEKKTRTERETAFQWQLSDREKRIIELLNKNA